MKILFASSKSWWHNIRPVEGLTGLIERNVTVLANSAKEEIDAAHRLDLGFICIALPDKILCVSIENVDLGRGDIDYRTGYTSASHKTLEQHTVREKLAEHEGMVGLGMILRETDVFVHIESNNILEPARCQKWDSSFQ